jgi:hypothetical protein
VILNFKEIAVLEWKKQVPNEEGYWLRVNAGHGVQLHRVWFEPLIPRFKDKLIIKWGWGGNQNLCTVESIKEKLEYFYWCGPVLNPPKEAL